jgi:hypothetical protein
MQITTPIANNSFHDDPRQRHTDGIVAVSLGGDLVLSFGASRIAAMSKIDHSPQGATP